MTAKSNQRRIQEAKGDQEVSPQAGQAQAPKTQLIGYETKFLEELLGYLNTKPHGEVRGFIDQIQKGQPVEV